MSGVEILTAKGSSSSRISATTSQSRRVALATVADRRGARETNPSFPSMLRASRTGAPLMFILADSS